MRQTSPFVTAAELDDWIAEAGVAVGGRDAARLRVRLDAVRDRVRAATSQTRSAQVRSYVRELSDATTPLQHSAEPRTPALHLAEVPTHGIGRALQTLASREKAWYFPWKGVAIWAVVALLAAAAARMNRNNAFTHLISIPTWYGVPVLAGAAHAALECGRTRVRSGRALALLGSVVAWFLAWAFLYLVLDARGCREPGDASGLAGAGAIAVGMASLAGITSAERGNRDWAVVASGVILAVPFWIMYALFAIMKCAHSR